MVTKVGAALVVVAMAGGTVACGGSAEVALDVVIDAVRPAVVQAGVAGGSFTVEVDVRVTGSGWAEPPALECVLTAAPAGVVPTFAGCAPVIPSEGGADEVQIVPVSVVVAPGVPAGVYTVGFAASACVPGSPDPSPGDQDVCDDASASIVVEVVDGAATSAPTTAPVTSAPAPTAAPTAPPAPATAPPPPPTTAAPVAVSTTAPQPAVTAELVVDGSFDAAPAIGGLPSAPGAWVGDTTALVPGGVIVPRTGATMIQFVDTGLEPSDRTETSQLWQLIDVTSYAAQIDAGGAVADATAWFHRIVGGPPTDRRFDLRVHAFDGAAADVPARYTANSATAVQGVSVITDGSAWTQAAASLAVPPGTRFLLVEIYAFEDVVNDAIAPEFEGHYADDVSLTLRLG